MASTDSPVDMTKLNGLNTGLFCRIALDYAEELYPVFFPESVRTGSAYPLIKRNWDLIRSLRDKMEYAVPLCNSIVPQQSTQSFPGMGEQLIKIFQSLVSLPLEDRIHEGRVMQTVIPEGNAVCGFNDWERAGERYAAFSTAVWRDHDKSMCYLTGMSYNLCSKMFADFIMQPVQCFRSLLFEPLKKEVMLPNPFVRISLTRKNLNGNRQYTLPDDLDSIPYPKCPATVIREGCDTFRFQFRPWFTNPYYCFIQVQLWSWGPAVLGGKNVTSGEWRVIFDSGSTTPLQGQYDTPLFSMPESDTFKLEIRSIRVLVQPVVTNYLDEALLQRT